jgi:hypothetical protein
MEGTIFRVYLCCIIVVVTAKLAFEATESGLVDMGYIASHA